MHTDLDLESLEKNADLEAMNLIEACRLQFNLAKRVGIPNPLDRIVDSYIIGILKIYNPKGEVEENLLMQLTTESRLKIVKKRAQNQEANEQYKRVHNKMKKRLIDWNKHNSYPRIVDKSLLQYDGMDLSGKFKESDIDGEYYFERDLQEYLREEPNQRDFMKKILGIEESSE